MSALAKISYFGRTAAQGVRHAPFVHLVAVTTLSISLFAVGIARGTGQLLEGVLNRVGGQVQLTAYLQPEVSAQTAQALIRELEQSTGGTAKLVLPAEALGRLARELGPLGETLTDLPDNPLPPSIELFVPPQRRTPEDLNVLAQALRKREGVTDVDYGEAAVERLSAIVRAVRFAGAVGFGVLVLATVLIVAATLQLAIYARRQEIEIQKLVGATDRFVKAPFLLEGLLQGLMGAGIALLGLWAFSAWAAPRLGELFAFLWLPDAGVSLLGPALAVELGLAGSLLGLFGSALAVSRFSRV